MTIDNGLWYELRYKALDRGRWILINTYLDYRSADAAYTEHVIRARTRGDKLTFRLVRCEALSIATPAPSIPPRIKVENFLRD